MCGRAQVEDSGPWPQAGHLSVGACELSRPSRPRGLPSTLHGYSKLNSMALPQPTADPAPQNLLSSVFVFVWLPLGGITLSLVSLPLTTALYTQTPDTHLQAAHDLRHHTIIRPLHLLQLRALIRVYHCGGLLAALAGGRGGRFPRRRLWGRHMPDDGRARRARAPRRAIRPLLHPACTLCGC